MADGTITISTLLDQSGITKGLKSMKTGFVNVAKGATVLATAIGGLAVVGGKYNGELQQTAFLLNRLDNTTQEMINTNAEQARALGMTSKQYKDCSASTATFMKSMGMSTKEINKMLPKMVELTANGAAFANVPITEAMEAISSASMGNYEALGKLNIEMSDALINESSYAKSLGKTTQQMSMSEKTQAIYNTMLERGGHLTGFAAAESNSFSTSLQLAKTKAMETAGTLGETLLPLLQPLLDKFIELADNVKIGAENFKSMAEESGGVQEVFTNMLENMDTLAPEFTQKGIDFVINFINGFKDKIPEVVPYAVSLILSIVNTISANMPQIVALGGEIIDKLILGISNSMPTLMQYAPSIIWSLIKALLLFIPQMLSIGVRIIASIIDGITQEVPAFLQSGCQAMADWIRSVTGFEFSWQDIGRMMIKGVINGVLGMKTWAINIVKGFFNDLITGIKNMLDINSPSKLMRDEIGKYMAQGVAVGFTLETDNVSKNMNQKLKATVEGMRNTLNLAPIGIQNGEGASNTTSNNTTINFNTPVESPYQTYKAVRKVGRELGFA